MKYKVIDTYNIFTFIKPYKTYTLWLTDFSNYNSEAEHDEHWDPIKNYLAYRIMQECRNAYKKIHETDGLLLSRESTTSRK